MTRRSCMSNGDGEAVCGARGTETAMSWGYVGCPDCIALRPPAGHLVSLEVWYPDDEDGEQRAEELEQCLHLFFARHSPPASAQVKLRVGSPIYRKKPAHDRVCLLWQATWTACGRGVLYALPDDVTRDREEVTCPACRVRMRRG